MSRIAVVAVTALALSWAVPAAAQSEVIHVSTAQEFADAIGPNRTIILAAGEYVLNQVESSTSAWFEPAGDNPTIRDCTGLTIQGAGLDRTWVLSSESGSNVLTVLRGQDVTITEMSIGHFPQVQGCRGNALRIENSGRVTVSDTRLYGSGSVGIEASNTDTLRVERSVFDDCTSSAFELFDVRDAQVVETTVAGMDVSFHLVRVLGNTALRLERSSVTGNSVGALNTNPDRGVLFDIGGANASVTLTDVEFIANQAADLCRGDGTLTGTGITWRANLWRCALPGASARTCTCAADVAPGVPLP